MNLSLGFLNTVNTLLAWLLEKAGQGPEEWPSDANPSVTTDWPQKEALIPYLPIPTSSL